MKNCEKDARDERESFDWRRESERENEKVERHAEIRRRQEREDMN